MQQKKNRMDTRERAEKRFKNFLYPEFHACSFWLTKYLKQFKFDKNVDLNPSNQTEAFTVCLVL